MLRKTSKKKWIISGVLFLFILLILWVIWSNTALEVTYITVKCENLPEEFLEYRIAHISDFHNADMVDELIEILQKSAPDMIAITGDLVDAYHTDTARVISFMKQAVKIAPCYYVRGNHETIVTNNVQYWAQLEAMGVTILQNEKTTVSKGDKELVILGVDDPVFHTTRADSYMEDVLSECMINESRFTLLLSHRPEFFSVYAKCGVDLALTGHAHGGQWRLPFVGGVFAPNQGAFPEYDSGLYKKDGKQMIVSRGIGNSSFPIRFNNRPEVILVELKK